MSLHCLGQKVSHGSANLEAPAGAAAQPEGGDGHQVVTRSALGAWFLKSDASRPGLNCAVLFSSVRGGTQLAIFGPTPRPAGQKGGTLTVAVGDLAALLRSMRDQESGMELHLRQGAVFRMDYEGFDLARAAMLDCVAGRAFAGKTLDQALAEIRPLGRSTITGNVFYKGAALARKQYPPKGSQAVGLIWMTDDFKRWHEQIKKDKQPPGQMPERIAKHFMRTTITDDQGGFTFTRLPAGEYMLIADFSYQEQVTRSELVGQTHVFRGTQHVGTQDHMAYWTETVKKPTTFEKTVVIKNDGDSLTVSLDKSLLFCFFACL